MDVVKAAARLRSLLIDHERTVGIIASLDDYIMSKTRQAICSDIDLHYSCHANQVSIATGVKQMYECYKLRKIQQVQKLSRFIISSIDPSQAAEDQTPDNQPPVTMDTVASQITRHSLIHCRHE